MKNSDRAEMNDIIDFLNAQCDGTERRAKLALEAVSERWDWELIAQQLHACCDTVPNIGRTGQHLHRNADPRRTLAEVEVIRQVINDYRVADGAIIRAENIDYDDPGWRGICAGRDAFKSVLRAYAKAAGFKPQM